MLSPQPAHLRAEETFIKRDWSALEFEARRLLRADPTDGLARSYLGIAICGPGDPARYELGLAEHKKATELGPGYAMTWHNYAYALLVGHERFVEAIEAVQNAIQIDPGDAVGREMWIGALLGLGRIQDAGAVLGKAMGLYPKIASWETRMYDARINDTILNLRGVKLSISMDEDGDLQCESITIPIYGTGSSFGEAYEDFLEMAYTAFTGYSGELTSPLSEEAVAYAQERILEMNQAADEVLDDPETLTGIREGMADVAAGRTRKWEAPA